MNIPYLRGLNLNVIRRIVYLTEEQMFDKGDVILMRYMSNDRIMIIWSGQVQVRIERTNPATNK